VAATIDLSTSTFDADDILSLVQKTKPAESDQRQDRKLYVLIRYCLKAGFDHRSLRGRF